MDYVDANAVRKTIVAYRLFCLRLLHNELEGIFDDKFFFLIQNHESIQYKLTFYLTTLKSSTGQMFGALSSCNGESASVFSLKNTALMQGFCVAVFIRDLLIECRLSMK